VDPANTAYSSTDGILFNKSQTTLIQCPGGKAGSISIPSGVTSIGSGAFSYCNNLTSITVDPANTTYISVEGMLFDINQTTLIQCPEGKLGNFTIPSSVTSIGTYAFSRCSNLTSISIPPSVICIGSYAFSHCNNLTSISIPSSVTSIQMATFDGCSNLTSITIPSSVTSIDFVAFAGCSRLSSAIFLGNAPAMFVPPPGYVSPFLSNAGDFALYFFDAATGFTGPTWKGYPTVNMGQVSPVSPWLVSNGFPHDTDMMADQDGDGVSLLMAYALALNPRQNLSGSVPRPVIAGDQMTLTFYAGSEGITYRVETSDDLQNWNTDGITLSSPDANGYRTAWFLGGGPNRFMRLSLSR
jgi:hypothetical protein